MQPRMSILKHDCGARNMCAWGNMQGVAGVRAEHCK